MIVEFSLFFFLNCCTYTAVEVLIRLPSTGTHTMALLERLEPGSVYLVKISASNQIGDGPFSQTVELAPKLGNTHRSKNPRHSDRGPDTAGTRHLTQYLLHYPITFKKKKEAKKSCFFFQN